MQCLIGRAKRSLVCPNIIDWTQWLFLKFHANGLAYREKAPVDWCPQCNTTAGQRAGFGGRTGTVSGVIHLVIKKDLDQWLFRITQYAEELLDFSKIEWPNRGTGHARKLDRTQVRGVEFEMRVKNSESSFRAFTNAPGYHFWHVFCGFSPPNIHWLMR